MFSIPKFLKTCFSEIMSATTAVNMGFDTEGYEKERHKIDQGEKCKY